MSPNNQTRLRSAQQESRDPVNKDQAFKQVEIGRILSVEASSVNILINKAVIRSNQLNLAQLGTILKIVTRSSVVVAMVSSLKIGGTDDDGLHDGCLAQLNILGEISTNQTTRETMFFRGVRTFPVLGEAAYNMSHDELELIFNREEEACIEFGKLHQDNKIISRVRTDDLLSKHFAIIGSTGSGKSCTVALVLQATLDANPNAHVVLFDPHNEYSQSFGDKAEVVRQDTLDLPLWMFNFEETVELLTSKIEDHAREEMEILHEIILKAKFIFEKSQASADVSSTMSTNAGVSTRITPHISLDSPVPYRIRDLLRLLDHEMGKLENTSNIAPYKRLARRIDQMLVDPRYQFLFRNQAAPTEIEDIIGRLFRIPVNRKPVCILDLSGIPSEMLNIVVAVVGRLAFDLAMWSNRKLPILLVCEEAHRYIPSDRSLGFASTRKSISRIAKEGRKYGVSLGIISQRPSELSASTLSQCSTIFSMRLSNEIDQNYVKSAVPDGAKEILAFLPSLGTAEAMVFGESVNMPMRVILDTLPEQYRPHSSSAKFTDLWQVDHADAKFMERVYQGWRTRTIILESETPEPTVPQEPPANQKKAANPVEWAPQQTRSVPIAPPQMSVAATMREDNAHNSAPKAQSISDVKRLLNNAFNRV